MRKNRRRAHTGSLQGVSVGLAKPTPPPRPRGLAQEVLMGAEAEEAGLAVGLPRGHSRPPCEVAVLEGPPRRLNPQPAFLGPESGPMNPSPPPYPQDPTQPYRQYRLRS